MKALTVARRQGKSAAESRSLEFRVFLVVGTSDIMETSANSGAPLIGPAKFKNGDIARSLSKREVEE